MCSRLIEYWAVLLCILVESSSRVFNRPLNILGLLMLKLSGLGSYSFHIASTVPSSCPLVAEMQWSTLWPLSPDRELRHTDRLYPVPLSKRAQQKGSQPGRSHWQRRSKCRQGVACSCQSVAVRRVRLLLSCQRTNGYCYSRYFLPAQNEQGKTSFPPTND